MNNHPKTRNISYQVFLRTRKTQGLLEEKLKNSQGSNIVYCSDYKTVNLTTGYLRSSGIPAVALHEGLDDDHKRASRATFMSKDKITLVTTVYSGGYIYRPETSMIIHCNLPRSIERYRKETKLDRVDNNISECILYFSLEDQQRIKKSMSQSKYLSDGRS